MLVVQVLRKGDRSWHVLPFHWVVLVMDDKILLNVNGFCCRYYEREIAAYDIQTKRVDVYGQDAGYQERVMLLYDGLHYDALAIAAAEGAGPEADITIFQAGSQEAASILHAAETLVAQVRSLCFPWLLSLVLPRPSWPRYALPAFCGFCHWDESGMNAAAAVVVAGSRASCCCCCVGCGSWLVLARSHGL